MTTAEVAKLLTILRSVWTTKPIDEHTITAWQWAMDDIPFDLASKAVTGYLRNGGEFFPVPSQIRALVAADLTGPPLLPATAWQEVMDEIRRIGFMRGGERRFSHPLIASAVDSMGWDTLCMSEKPEVTRAQFYKIFESMQERASDLVRRDLAPAIAAMAAPSALPEGDDDGR